MSVQKDRLMKAIQEHTALKTTLHELMVKIRGIENSCSEAGLKDLTDTARDYYLSLEKAIGALQISKN